MAKRVCRTADRFDPTGMPRPRCRVRRMPPPPPAAVVHDILQWRPHTSLLGEGCAALAYGRTGRAESLPPNSRRAAPPICPHLIFDRHRRGKLVIGHDPNRPARCRTWVKAGRTRIEQMSSAVHPITDVGQYNRPRTEQRTGLIDVSDGLYRFHPFLKSPPTPPPRIPI